MPKKLDIEFGQTNVVIDFPRSFQTATQAQQDRKRRVVSKRLQRPEITQDVRNEWDAHQAKHEHPRQPLLKGLTSKYDLKLFQEAQSKACEELVSPFFRCWFRGC